jgi:anti-sigma factor RsiW
MTCRDIEELTPVYLSGELENAGDFRAHLASCPHCATDIDQQIAVDQMVREAAGGLPDASRLSGWIRHRAAIGRSLTLTKIAVTVLIAAIVSYRTLPTPRVCADAAFDHRLEVIEHQPRRWRSDPAEIQRLAARFQLTDVNALAPVGFKLEHAKTCEIDGTPALHLVYSNGAEEISMFIRRHVGAADRRLSTVTIRKAHLAFFRTDRLEAVVVTAGSSAECIEFGRFAARVL